MKWYFMPVWGFFYLLSLLPFRVLYFVSDVLLFPLVYYIIRYRRGLVRRQLSESFPERDDVELRQIARRFYHFLCDYIVETIKLMSMSQEEIRRRIQFVGVDQVPRDMEATGHNFALVYLGHYGNWEWVSSFPLWIPEDVHGGQIYHPLRNKSVDKMFLDIRQQFGAQCIPMKETYRRLFTWNREGKKALIGFISDQSPKWEAMHQWCTFLHHDTSFFIGVERISRQVDANIYYLDISRPARGYYRAELKLVTTDSRPLAGYELTGLYVKLLEENIQREPHLWLWTHNRWKRTKTEWEKRQQSKQK